MLALSGIYDGRVIKLLEKAPKNKKFKVIVTFVEEFDDAESLRDFSAQTSSLTFWEDKKEDIYQDYLLKKKKRKIK